MNKQDFLDTLRDRLSATLSQEEVADSVEFYSEMINDRMEEGLSEEDASFPPVPAILKSIFWKNKRCVPQNIPKRRMTNEKNIDRR